MNPVWVEVLRSLARNSAPFIEVKVLVRRSEGSENIVMALVHLVGAATAQV